MSIIDALGTGVQTRSAPDKMSKMDTQDFLKIMVSELQQQDPFEPMSSQDLLTQIGQMRDIQSAMDASESNEKLIEALEALSINQKLAAAGSMLGKIVNGKTSDGESVQGLVTSVKVEDGKVYLELDSGRRLDLDHVVEVTADDGQAGSNGAGQDETGDSDSN